MKRLFFILASMVLPLLGFSQDKIEISHGPYLQNVLDTEVTIVWIASDCSVGWVELAPDDKTHFYASQRPKYYDARNGLKTESWIHSVRITGLRPGTVYRYRVFSQEVLDHKGKDVKYGKVASTRVFHVEPLKFRTSSPDMAEIRFVMLNDIHGNDGRFRNLLGQCDFNDTDLVLFLGDLASSFDSEEQVFGDFMDTAVEVFAKQIPMYYTRGNHETRGALAYRFQDYFSPGAGHIYFMLRKGPVCFIVLDCGEDKPDNDIEYSGITAFDAYRSEQAEWLREAVQSDMFRNAPFKVVACHMPPFSRWHGELEIREKFVPILNDSGVDLMLCGHLHKYMRTEPDADVRFPVIVNSNNMLLRATATADSLRMTVTDEGGNVIDTITMGRKE